MENTEEKKMDGTENTVKRMVDITTWSVVIAFKDKSGFVVPLTDLQGAFVLRSLGFRIDPDTGAPLHYTDDEMCEIYGLKK